jgi:hypothetical protein
MLFGWLSALVWWFAKKTACASEVNFFVIANKVPVPAVERTGKAISLPAKRKALCTT